MKNNIIEKPQKGRVEIIAFIIISILSLIVFFGSNYDNPTEKMTSLIWAIVYAIFAIIFVKGFFTKFNKKAMGVMKSFCSQQEVNNLLKNEKFKAVSNENLKEKILFSKKWIIADGTYIPKNFIIGVYIKVAAYGHYHVNFVLINSKTWMIDIGAHKEVFEVFMNKILNEIPHIKVYNNYLDANPGDLKKNYDNCIKKGITLEGLINKN